MPWRGIWVWQQDSAPCHVSKISMQLLTVVTKDLWPPNSGHLNPLDYFVGTMSSQFFPTFKFNHLTVKRVIRGKKRETSPIVHCTLDIIGKCNYFISSVNKR
uniref:Uncharacterized protein n=1 Tax=Lepeophtheirus salmonis TaxID=72036 RepID=A0A0K2V2S7_LEPSM